MKGFKIVNLKMMLETVGEERVTPYLSNFSCPMNKDVETFLKRKAVEFSKQGLSRTHLVFASYKSELVLVGYFCLANKPITIQSEELSSTARKRIGKFATYDREIKSYYMACPLIAQLGKNYADGYNELISGDELLKMACDMVMEIQMAVGGKYVYLECEDVPALIDFYRSNGFVEFDRRTLDKDETNIKGDYLVQMIKYLH